MEHPHNTLTPALEDYLETIYRLLIETNESRTRVRDIARQRNVKSASVTPALKRLSEMGYVDYELREAVKLTPEGEKQARRVFARHNMLFKFFHEILGMEKESAQNEACGLEHALSEEGLDRFARFFEYISLCPNPSAIDDMKHCGVFSGNPTNCNSRCKTCPQNSTNQNKSAYISLVELNPGVHATICQVKTEGQHRQRLLEMGILPGAEILKLHTNKEDNSIEIILHTAYFTISYEDAKVIIITLNPPTTTKKY